MPFQMASNINWGEVFEEAIANGDEHVDGKDADYQNVISTELMTHLVDMEKNLFGRLSGFGFRKYPLQ